MAKDDRESRLRRGRQQVADWGLAADTPVAVLGEHLGRDLAADLAIVERLGGTEATAVPLLLQIEVQADDKLLRREARRSLYRLEQRGIEVPHPSPEPGITLPATSALEGSMSPVDGRGDQLVWIEKRTGRGSDFVFAVINDPEGLREVDYFHSSRKEVLAAQAEMLRRNEVRIVPVDWHHCDFLIERARRWAEERGQRTADYARLRTQLTAEAPIESDHPVFARIPREQIEAEPEWLAKATLLVTEPELRTWFFGREQLQAYIDEFQQIRDSPLVLNRSQQTERQELLVQNAVEQIFAGERGASWSRRLLEMAYFFDMTKRHPQAKSTLASALALQSSEHGGRGIPLCEALVRGSLMAHLQMAQREEEEHRRSSLLVTPGEALRETERKR